MLSVTPTTTPPPPPQDEWLTSYAKTARRSPFNDRINNSKLWGPLYDGRSIITDIHEKFLAGASLEECQAAVKAVAPPEMGARLINTWA